MSSRPCAKRRRLIVNAAFAAAVLLAAGLAWWALRRSSGPALYARADFGMGAVEMLPLDTDYDYYYQVDGYIVHLQVRDGAVAFLDSQCPDHVCEAFGWLSEPGQWASCVPAGVMVTVEPAQPEGT
ncbi:MAG TPA: NusG domain II-containing protein [Candidatus Faecalibacterium faecipullorum]|mgnify:CR=1 FL=1|uniref:NusG domain II-containing protein n=1 Tax=Candidatus Faecalibacterium faecipullorum TaxID=2838578 RepID=A0A9D2S8M3_9FIRM|nr:NusG domain II-containing protein [Candidatus Faecalibacterium faecipullorum]